MSNPLKTITAGALALFALSCASAASADDKAAFQSAYQQYKQHLEANETSKALDAASQAYTLGSKLFGKRSVNTANLAVNYAVLLNDTEDYRQSGRVLRGKLPILEDHYGSDAIELVPALVQLGRAKFDPRRPREALEHFSRASWLSDSHENKLYRAQQCFDISRELLQRGGIQFAEQFIQNAHSIYVEELEANDVRLGLTSFHMAMWATGRQQFEKAAEYFNGSLTAFKTDDGPMREMEKTVRQRLVGLYENMEQPERATEHCLALGARQSWSTSPTPIHRARPVFSQEAIDDKLSGEVALEFTIDEQGYVRDAAVTRSSNAALNDVAITMIRKYRYAPRFEGGAPVATDSVEYVATLTAEAPEVRRPGARERRARRGDGARPRGVPGGREPRQRNYPGGVDN
jgi:TonB family protein